MASAADLAHVLGGTMLVLALLMLGQRRQAAVITLYALQSAALALAAVAQGWAQGRFGLWIMALVVLAAQAVLIPMAMRRVPAAPARPGGGGPAAMAVGVAVVVLAILAVRNAALPAAMAREDLAAALSVMGLGLLMAVLRQDALGPLLGLLAAASGCTLAGLAMPELPLPVLLLGLALLALPALGALLLQRRATAMDPPA